ncbi:MAG: hypothetical protein AB7K09_02855 [Planctomycetota bacterium]
MAAGTSIRLVRPWLARLVAVLALTAPALVVVLSCTGHNLPDKLVPYGETLGEINRMQEKLADVRVVGVAENRKDALFFAREAACAAVLNLRGVDSSIGGLRAYGDEWRSIVAATVLIREEGEPTPASKEGGVRIEAFVVVQLTDLAARVRDLLSHPPQGGQPQTAPARND